MAYNSFRAHSEQTTYADDQESSITTRVILHTGASQADLQEWLDAKYPGTHCQHGHDCCANWYNSGCRIANMTATSAKVVQSAYLNI